MSLLTPVHKRASNPVGSVGFDFNHPYLTGRILALNFNTNNINNISANYVRKYTGTLSSPVFPQTITKTGSDIIRVDGAIRLNATSTGNYYKTLTGIDSFSSSTAIVTFIARFKVNRFISGGSSYNSIFCQDNVLNTFALSIDSGGNLYCNGSSTSLGAISFGQWVNVEIIQKPSGASVAYINNKRVDFTSLSNPASSSYAFWVASDANGNRSCDLTISHIVAISPGIYTGGMHNRNPWQIFEPESVPFYFDVSGTPTTTASGSLAALSLSAPTATTVQTSTASGSLAALSLTTPDCTATTVSTTTASGSLAAISLSAPNVTSVQTSIASGSLVALSLTAPTATVSTVASVIASGNIIAININAPEAQAVLSVKGTGYFNPMTLIAPNHVLAPSTTVPEIVNFDTMIQREVSFDTLITRTVSYTVER